MIARANDAAGMFDELIVDNFAGGGGASLGIERAVGRAVDIAINHDRDAILMHQANHPHTRHLCEDVWHVDPVEATAGRRVGLAWFSPDCKHFSKAKGGKPVSRKIRGLAWVVIRWAKRVRPRIIMLENVEEFVTWGPLSPDGMPCPKRRGQTFRSWTVQLRKLGYDVQWRELRACDYGTPTIRKRLFLIARCDGQPIVWPDPTHAAPAKAKTLGLKRWRTAAECIDWSLPCHSIFLTPDEARAVGVRRPLADATLRRIANGIIRYVVNAAEPFIVTCNHAGSAPRSAADPMRTVTASRDAHGLVVPTLIANTTGNGPARASDPLKTVTTGGHHALVSAFLAKHYGGVIGIDARQPTGTITQQDHHAVVTGTLVGAGGPAYAGKPKPIDEPFTAVMAENHRALAAAHMLKLRGTCKDGQDLREPAPTCTSGGTHAGMVYAFLTTYYGNSTTGAGLKSPIPTAVTKDRISLVTVQVDGEPYIIADIGMRMLAPRELARAQGFPDSYRLTGTKSSQVARIGNSVCPQMAEALVRANFANAQSREAAAATAVA